MIQTDLFHQMVYKDADGFYAIMDYTQPTPCAQVYTPQDEWCGGTGATNHYSQMGDIRYIIKWRKQWEASGMGLQA